MRTMRLLASRPTSGMVVRARPIAERKQSFLKAVAVTRPGIATVGVLLTCGNDASRTYAQRRLLEPANPLGDVTAAAIAGRRLQCGVVPLPARVAPRPPQTRAYHGR